MSTVLSKKTYKIIYDFLKRERNDFAHRENECICLLNEADQKGDVNRMKMWEGKWNLYSDYTDAANIILNAFAREFEVIENDKRI